MSGEIEVPGARSPVTIRRDRYGIPYIEAASDEDAWYGVGFCQGQDRAFQLEMLLRIARGTVSELAGSAGLGMDRLARRIGFAEGAERQAGLLDADIRANIEAFARGINDGVRLGSRRIPHEFTLLRTEPTPYSLVDIVAAAKLQAFVLASNWDIELARYHILMSDGPEALAALDPAYPADHPVSTPPGAAQGVVADRLSEDLASLRKATGYAGGSNNWALAPTKTATSRPILSNDPHLRPTLPPHWYLAHIRTPEWAAAGATFIGGPAIPAGHNGVAAWGVTAALVDTTDLFLEELGDDGRSVRQGDGFVPCEVRDEVIRVKGADDVIERVVITPRGPIVAEGPGQRGSVAQGDLAGYTACQGNAHDAQVPLVRGVPVRLRGLAPVVPEHGLRRCVRQHRLADHGDCPCTQERVGHCPKSGMGARRRLGEGPCPA